MVHRTNTARTIARAVQVPIEVLLHHRDVGVSPVEFLVYLHLLAHADTTHEGRCQLSMGSIARNMGITRGTIKHHLTELKEKDLIRIETRRKDHGGFDCNQYDTRPLADRCRELQKESEV